MKLRPWTVGLFIVLGFGLFTAILFLIGSREKAFSRHLELYSEFSDLGGLERGAKVRVSGLDAGELKKVEIPQSPSGKFRVQLQVEEKMHGMIRKDSVVSIETEGVGGDKFLSIKKGSAQAPEVQPGTTLSSKEPFDLATLMERGSGVLDDVHGTVTDLHGRMDIALDSITRTVDHGDTLMAGVQPDVNKIAKDGSRITGSIDALVTDLNAGKGPAGMLLKDAATEQQLRATLSNVQQTSINANQASARGNEIAQDFQSRNVIANAQITLDSLQAISLQLNTTVKNALAQDDTGQDGARNLRETLSNLNRSTANLADDTEALKHEFFFKAFFKKRGFYNLDELTPSEYLAACVKRCDGSRTWLQASRVFVRGTNGKEQLSETGPSEINTEVAPVVDALAGQIVVVEGYSASNSPDQQYADSWGRADLVRRYLEEHYHLKHSDVGIVPLRSHPPQSAGRNSWDGAAITLLKVKGAK